MAGYFAWTVEEFYNTPISLILAIEKEIDARRV